MSLRIIQDNEVAENFEDRVVLIDMGEPGLYGVRNDPSFLLARVPHEYVCFDSRRGEVIRLEDAALVELRGLA